MELIRKIFAQLFRDNSDIMIKNLDPNIKPPSDICPEEFCWWWTKKGSKIAQGFHENIDIALQNTKKNKYDKCRYAFGKCKRMFGILGDSDYYEPVEPLLKKSGLPWFYFIPSPDSLAGDQKRKYKIESEKLWGKKHYEK